MLPAGVTLAAIVPLMAAIGITSLFAFIYLRRYRNPYESDTISFITCVFSLIVVLITSALLPVDIFLVSYMKQPDGEFKDWAANQTAREAIEDTVLYSYYSLYGLVFVLIFAVIPFVYFYFEEKEEIGFEQDDRLCSAFKYTMVFVFVAIVIFVAGAVVPLRDAPPSNSTEWYKFEFLINDLGKNKGEDALSMVLSVLSVAGMVNLIFYTGVGIFSWPMGLIRGTKSVRSQIEEIHDQHLVNQSRINALREKERLHGRLSNRERRQLATLEDSERQVTREEQAVDEHRTTYWYRLRGIIRPVEITAGVVLGLLAVLIWLSLLLTNIDKAMNSLGMKMGYALPKRTLPNPIDIILVNCQKVFPLDYVMILIIVWFLVLCTMSGLRNLGIRILCVRMYKLKAKKTTPQGLLLTCVTLMLTVLAINVLLYCISPQYVTYGSQKFVPLNGTLPANVTDIACDATAGPAECTMTTSSALLTRFFYKAWIFGAIYYWASWAFVGVSGVAFFYVILRKAKTVADGVNDADELEESDEEDLIIRRRIQNASMRSQN
ncbi:putative lysosomal cobalamin transporter [Halotydeus destructor]|nr:putative lysosomal cobalamin transporter [Halotydeus destructor]